jgi:hypothetical protein
MDDWIEECMCGHAPDEHSESGECQVEGCGCACYEALEPEEDES